MMHIVIHGMVGSIVLLAFTRDHYVDNFWGWLLKTRWPSAPLNIPWKITSLSSKPVPFFIGGASFVQDPLKFGSITKMPNGFAS